MASVYLMLSRPGAYTKEGLILGNPEAVKNNFSPTGSYPGTPDIALAVGHKYRVLSVVTDAEIDIVQVSENETSATASGVATRIPAPSSGNTAYACLVHPSTVGIYVKTA